MHGENLKTKLFRTLLNCYPMFFGTGGKLIFLKADWSHAIVRLNLNLWTKNYVGTIFGGSQFAAADPFCMILLMNCLGKEFVVWDKSAKIDFKKPGKTSMQAEFIYTPEEIASIREKVLADGKFEFQKSIQWVDKQGNVISIMERTIYVATKVFFKQRQSSRLKKRN